MSICFARSFPPFPVVCAPTCAAKMIFGRSKDELLETGGISAWCGRGDVDVAPVVWWSQTLRISFPTSQARLAQDGCVDLLHRQPGDIIDQLLLGIHILLQARVPRRHGISRFQLLLHGLLLGGSRAIVLTIVPVVVGRALVELQGRP